MAVFRTLLPMGALLAAAPALAQTDPATGWSGSLGLGAGIAPEYPGAKHSAVGPFALGDLKYGPYFLQMRGLSLRANLVPSDRIVAGPLIRYGSGRDHDVDNARVARLDEIDATVAGGGFIGFRLGTERRLELTLSATGSSNGALGTASLSYAALRGRRFFVNLDTEANYASGEYNRTWFGVTPAESARSGLSAYRPRAGLRDIGLGVTAGWLFSDHWGMTGRIGYSQLMGDAADSPIVDREGSKGQLMGGLALTYRF